MVDSTDFGLIDSENEATFIREFDYMLLNKKNALSFIRCKKHLKFRTSPTKDAFRHIDFVKDENDFKLLSAGISTLAGLGGHLEEIHKEYLLWEFGKEINKTAPIYSADSFAYVPDYNTVNIFNNQEDKLICSFILNLRNDTDVFQLANLLASLKNNVAREVDSDSKKNTIRYEFIPS